MAKTREEQNKNQIRVLLVGTHFNLNATQLKQLTRRQRHLFMILKEHSNLFTNMKAVIFQNNVHTNIFKCEPDITLN